MSLTEAKEYLESITKSIRSVECARKKRELNARKQRDAETGAPERKRLKLEGDELKARLTLPSTTAQTYTSSWTGKDTRKLKLKISINKPCCPP